MVIWVKVAQDLSVGWNGWWDGINHEAHEGEAYLFWYLSRL